MTLGLSGRIIQVSTSRGGVPKRAVFEGVATKDGIQGDSWAHPAFHGGPMQALLLISEEAIDELRAMGYPLYAGALGENLTLQGLDRKQMRLGQTYRTSGGVILELTKMRTPCETLSVYGSGIQRAIYDQEVKAGNAASPRWGLSGFYARVIQPGVIRPGDTIALFSENA
jgi:MOSC domain-containing protein YiiM